VTGSEKNEFSRRSLLAVYAYTYFAYSGAFLFGFVAEYLLTERYWWAKIINSVYFVLNDNIFRTRFGGGGADKY